jgi:murein L,D-transpeptidase YcbB/YkuD
MAEKIHTLITVRGPKPLLVQDRFVSDIELTLSLDLLELLGVAQRGLFKSEAVDPDWHIPDDSSGTPVNSNQVAQWLRHGDLGIVIGEQFPQHPQYEKLRSVLADYQSMAVAEPWPVFPEAILRSEGSENRDTDRRTDSLPDNWKNNSNDSGQVIAKDKNWIPLLLARLQATHDLPTLKASTPNAPGVIEQMLSEGLRHFQARHGLMVTGKMDRETLAALNVPLSARIAEIKANLERWRWLPQKLPERYLQVNITDYQIDFMFAGRSELAIKVVVGREFRKTPCFASQVTTIETNPQWIVPKKLATADLLPILQRDPGLLVKKGFRVFQIPSGKELNLEKIDWQKVRAEDFPFRLVQQPGLQNALGRIKFWIPNPFGIFLHDSPARDLFDRPIRTFSSGCIRVEQPMRLAEFLLEQNANKSIEAFRNDVDSGVSRAIRLLQPVPIYVTYWTVWVDEREVVQFRPDIYRRNEEVVKRIEAMEIKE